MLQIRILKSFLFNIVTKCRRLNYLCPSSDSGSQEVESILQNIQSNKEHGMTMHKLAEDLKRRFNQEIAHVETLKKTISKVASDMSRDRDLTYAIERERDILSGLSKSDQQAKIRDLENKKLILIQEELVLANAEMAQMVEMNSLRSIQAEKTQILLDQLQVGIVQ